MILCARRFTFVFTACIVELVEAVTVHPNGGPAPENAQDVNEAICFPYTYSQAGLAEA
jgi:hypothetical protein